MLCEPTAVTQAWPQRRITWCTGSIPDTFRSSGDGGQGIRIVKSPGDSSVQIQLRTTGLKTSLTNSSSNWLCGRVVAKSWIPLFPFDFMYLMLHIGFRRLPTLVLVETSIISIHSVNACLLTDEYPLVLMAPPL